jgi:hypothetical protein
VHKRAECVECTDSIATCSFNGVACGTMVATLNGDACDSGGSAMPPVSTSYDDLLLLRAKELKLMLNERGIDSSDCFEKSDLARRIIERCSPASL